MEKISIKLDGLGCANCAAKIEERSSKITGLDKVVVDLSRSKLIAYTEADNTDYFLEEVKKIVLDLEPHVKVSLDQGRGPYLLKTTSTNASTSTCTDGCCGESSQDHSHDKHGHDHDHGHSHGVSDNITSFAYDKKTLLRLSLSLILLVGGILSESLPSLSIGLLLVSYGLSGYKVLLKSARNISKGHVFDENFLMSIATIGALAIGEYPEAVAVMIFYEVGEYFQNFAVAKSRNAIGALMNIRPDFANVLRGDFFITVDPNDVAIDDIILVKPGERIPLDGFVVDGRALIDTAALTGESLPASAEVGSSVLSGSVVKDGVLKIKVSSKFSESTVSRILELVENATANKAQTEYFITRFARVYTPFVVFAALGLALIPPFVLGIGDFSQWLYRGLVFLVISCPCALVVSVPLTFFSGIGNASKNGILIKGSNYLEALSTIDTVVFDKTGTLTEGVFEVAAVHLSKAGKDFKDTNKIAALSELHSNHPIAKSIVAYYAAPLNENDILSYEEISGYGTKLRSTFGTTLIGNRKWMEKNKIAIEIIDVASTLIYLAHEGIYLGAYEIKDKVKKDAKETILGLKAKGIETLMLTGDRNDTALAVSQEIGIEHFKSELLPEDKYKIVHDLISQNKKVAFLGDGINDAPVLAGANVGISMGAIGSDAAIEASDVVFMTDEPSKILKAIAISKRTKIIVTQNIVFALGIKFAIMGLGTLGITSMWMAIFADVGVSLLAVLNAMRAMKS